MAHTLTRRAALALLSSAPLAACAAPSTRKSTGPTGSVASSTGPSLDPTGFADLEQKHDARLGVYAVNTASGVDLAYRADERFAYCSTLKSLLAGLVLQRADLPLDRRLRYRRADLVDYSPVTEKRVRTGLTVRETLDAALRFSDNTAANLLFDQLGGPAAVQAGLRAIGDDVTHVDRRETELNEARPGDIRDTTTPRALAASLRAFAVDDALPADRRALLNDWMARNTTGDALIRAGAPEGWRVEDKTGAGRYGTRNDVAVLRPPSGAPVVLAVMTRKPDADAGYDDALVAAAARLVSEALTG
ncbi:class A beta-lactamase [Spongisporangium articulatum]|uniref:Beta-lactamase n=1 Tax=Spongisporangium articulatum TaxID=3362603 RepID=A0ABW8AQZ1_9ACTN